MTKTIIVSKAYLENLDVGDLVDVAILTGEEISALERAMSLVSDILQDRGTSVEKELNKRENKNGN